MKMYAAQTGGYMWRMIELTMRSGGMGTVGRADEMEGGRINKQNQQQLQQEQ